MKIVPFAHELDCDGEIPPPPAPPIPRNITKYDLFDCSFMDIDHY